MNNQESLIEQVTTSNSADKWQIYHRLQELGIACQCNTNKPLKIELDNTYIAIQLWSVSQAYTNNRLDLIDRLNHCWKLKSYRK